MVIIRCLVILLALSGAAAAEVKVSIALDKTMVYENIPINGTVIVQHDENEVVSPDSFQTEGKPLAVELLKDVPLSSGSSIHLTSYKFQVPGKTHGLYVMPAVTVQVGKRTYSTASIAYEVIGGEDTSSRNVSVILRLEPFVDGPNPIYLGQTAKFGYRILFNDNIEIREQSFPLLDAEGFRKNGDQQTADGHKGNLAFREIFQSVKPVNPGEYSFAPGFVTGYAYREGAGGQRTYTTSELRADAPGVTVSVKAFPEEGKPPSFNGAVGEDLDFRVILLTVPQVNVGDKILLSLNISGKGDLSDIPTPDLCCQPGFPGMLKQSDLPPVETQRGASRSSVVELYALTEKVTAIPSIQFSYFNPKSQKYVVIASQPIPMVVNPGRLPVDVPQSEGAKEIEKEVNNAEMQGMPWPKGSKKAGSIEIESVDHLQPADLQNRHFGTWWVMLLIPLGIGAYLIQREVKRKREKVENTPKPKSSQELFEEALIARNDPKIFYNALTKAFMLKLVECGLIDKPDMAPEQLPRSGITAEVRDFFLRIEAQRFAGQGQMTTDQVADEAGQLFARIKPHV